MATTSASLFDSAYESDSAPWVIGEPQPEVLALERDGRIGGAVLDPGCGTGEHTIHLARLGYDVRGIDFSPRAVEKARTNAAEQGVDAEFEVADAFALGEAERRYDTVLDSALFHVFEGEHRAAYVASLHAACRPGGVVHVLALSDAEPGFGPRIGDSEIREAFGAGWELEELRPARYRCVVVGDDTAAHLGVEPDTRVDQAAWLARVRRL
ncbi:class I SAM-dependent methyltransferase [Streptomonospora wellingtoniae]|uniref:Class I SAM-dependent methyltransferase n=1 Tax=Streptomonospora wellingtoniae TaxID=3075544 RepID=A0ABU2KRD4_9ACTN|nr:class I SAM-dependent methyltransferase [Streptomonospora sp. DSM 45055]MDT0301847.1 class I SAM-dependent methyltransferase [Streptomonospora sp. DSM 45055]